LERGVEKEGVPSALSAFIDFDLPQSVAVATDDVACRSHG
jgi:hypothetical protein